MEAKMVKDGIVVTLMMGEICGLDVRGRELCHSIGGGGVMKG